MRGRPLTCFGGRFVDSGGIGTRLGTMLSASFDVVKANAPSPAMFRAASGRGNGRCVEEQGLGDRRLHGRALERLGDQEGRLGPGSGEQPLRKGGDEDHRDGEFGEDILDRVDAARIVRKLDISKNQAWRVAEPARLPRRGSRPLQ